MPIPLVEREAADTMNGFVRQAVGQQREIQGFEEELAELAKNRFSIGDGDDKLVSWLPLSPDSFSDRLMKLAGLRQPMPKIREEIATFQQTHRARQVELLTRQLGLEKKLAVLVEDAYGLTPEERALLRSTRPVRDPLDVLEGKIRGGGEATIA